MKLSTLYGLQEEIIEEKVKSADNSDDVDLITGRVTDANDPTDLKVRLRATKKVDPDLYNKLVNFD
jgi:hypothetical protein